MKYSLLTLLFTLVLGSLMAQDIEFPDLDKSPMDAAHYPRGSAFGNYLDADDPDRNPKIKVLYSRPYKKDRKVFGELVPFGAEWRLGANETPEVVFYQNVEIGGTTVPRGVYTMTADIHEDHWVVNISNERHTAGIANRDASKIIARGKAMTSNSGADREQFTIGFQKVDEGAANMIFEWENIRATLPVNLYAADMAGEDKSPMDLAAYPARSRFQNFLKAEEKEANQPQIRVVYSRPQMKGRKVFGGLLEHGKMWRVGANQTTTVTFFNDVMVGGKEIPAGTYGLFAKVNEKDWEFILHKNVNSWGHPNHDEADNIVSVKAPTAKTPKTLEALSITYDDSKKGQVDIIVGWENTMARLPVMMK